MNRTRKKIFVAIVDYLLLLTSLCILILIRYEPNSFLFEIKQHLRPFSFIYLVWLLVFYIFELYDVTNDILPKKYIYAMIINGAIAVSVFYTVSGLGITPKTNLVLNLLIFTLLFIPWRGYIAHNFGRFFGRINTAIIGVDEHSLQIARDIVFNERMGYNLVCILRSLETEVPQWVSENNIAVVNSVAELKQKIDQHNISMVVVNDFWYGRIFTELYSLLHRGINFYNLPSFVEQFHQRIPIYAADEVWFLDNLKNVERSFYEVAKRLIDILLILIIAPVFAALFSLVALAIKINSPGPIFFKQTRVGKNETPFTIYKFRTMVQDAEKNGAQWAVKNDTRITKVGKFLRLTRIDELPQIINVARGEMSFIGPRPERPTFVEELEQLIPHYNLRHLVRPGLTGWAQVKFEYAATKEESAKKLEYDLYYIKNRSLIIEGKIVLKTIMTIISKRGQ